MNIGIYKITNTKNNKNYIGQSISLRERKSRHFKDLKNNKHPNRHLQAAYNKYGKDCFMFNVIEAWSSLEYITRQELTERELYYINKFDSAKKGYNQQEPNQDLTKFVTSEESKKLNQQNTKNKKELFVWKKSDFSFVGKFVSISEACNKLNIRKKSVYDSLAPNSKTKRKSVGGYLFTFTEDCPEKFKKTGPKARSIVIDEVEYSSFKEAAAILNIKEDTLRHRFRKK